MSNQLDWLSQKHARRADPATSKTAARSMKLAAPAICDKVLEVIRKCGPATQCEIATILGLDGYKVGKRLSDLKNSGLIEPLDKMTRKGPTGREQTVWRAKA